jgi:hypothetical protein
MEFDFKTWLLNEMPITSFNLKGKWGPEDKPYRYDQQSIGILTNPKGVEKIHRKWSNTRDNFDLYFVRGPKVWQQNFVGEVSQDWVREKLGLDIQPDEDSITVILTNNISGTTRVPLTAWAIAHRFAHGLYREAQFEQYFQKEVLRDFTSLTKQMFPNQDYWNMNAFSRGYRGGTILPLHIAQAVGTMKSARDGKVDNFNEFINELVAQYIITGKITFNPLPRSFMVRKQMAWGRDNSLYRSHSLEGPDVEEINDLLEANARKYEYYLQEVFNGLTGRIFVI